MSDPHTPDLILEETIPFLIEKMNAGDYTAAHGLISELRKSIPDNTEILGCAAVMAFKTGHIDEAVSILSDLIEKEPANQDHYTNLVKIFLSSDFAPARLVEVCTQALKTFGPDPYFFNGLGTGHAETGNNDRALESFEAALEIRPDFKSAHDKIIKVLLNTDRVSGRLVRACVRALKDVGPSSSYHHNLGVAYTEMKNNERALQSFDAALKLDPDSKQSHRVKSVPLLVIGQNEESLASYSRSLDPWNGEIAADKPSCIQEIYDKASATYEDNQMQARWGPMMAGFARPILGKKKNLSLLDAACGTGIAGQSMKHFATYLTGIDLSPGMLDIARNKKIYNDLIQGDMVDVMRGLDRQFDVIVSCCALYHSADLSPFFEQAARLLNPGGFLFISVDPSDDSMEIGISGPSEYAHSRGYLRRLAKYHQLDELKICILEHRRTPGFWAAFLKPA